MPFYAEIYTALTFYGYVILLALVYGAVPALAWVGLGRMRPAWPHRLMIGIAIVVLLHGDPRYKLAQLDFLFFESFQYWDVRLLVFWNTMIQPVALPLVAATVALMVLGGARHDPLRLALAAGFGAVADPWFRFGDLEFALFGAPTDPWHWITLGTTVAALFAFLWLAFKPEARGIKPILLPEYTVMYGHSPNEPRRLLEAAAAGGYLPDLDKVLAEVKNTTNAKPRKHGIDLVKLRDLARANDTKRLRRLFGYTLLALIGLAIFGGMMVNNPYARLEEALIPAIAIPAGLAAILATVHIRSDRDTLRAEYAADRYQPGADVLDDDNVIIHRTRDPFEEFGWSAGSWTMSVDCERGKDEEGGVQAPQADLSLTDIEDRITASVDRSGVSDGAFVPLYFVQGQNLPEVLLPSPGGPPKTRITASDLERMSPHPPSFRRYLMLQKSYWSGELLITYFLRVMKQRGDIVLELHARFLPPLGKDLRKVDEEIENSMENVIGDFLAGIFKGVFVLALSPFLFSSALMARIGDRMDTVGDAAQRAARNDPLHNYGAELSLRRRTSDLGAMSFFHSMDRQVTETAVNGRILRAFIDVLDEAGIDTTELREQRTTVMNQGIIVQGDLQAENVASGPGAKISNRGRKTKSEGAA